MEMHAKLIAAPLHLITYHLAVRTEYTKIKKGATAIYWDMAPPLLCEENFEKF
jgi:hypothetical protein